MPIDQEAVYRRILRASEGFFYDGLAHWIDGELDRLEGPVRVMPHAIKFNLQKVEPIVGYLTRSPEFSGYAEHAPPETANSISSWYAPDTRFSPQTAAAILRSLRDRPEPRALIARAPELLSPLETNFQARDSMPVGAPYEGIGELPPSRIASLLDRLLPAAESAFWLDIGSGDGKTLYNLARKHPSAMFMGFDLLDSGSSAASEIVSGSPNLRKAPPNANYFLSSSSEVPARILADLPEAVRLAVTGPSLLRPASDPDSIASNHLRQAAGKARADVVSIFYPYTTDRAMGAHLDPLSSMIASALYAMKPGATGVILTEHPKAAARAIARLGTGNETDFVWYSPVPLDERQIRNAGIEPFRPTKGAATNAFEGPAREGVFNWGYPIIFRKKPSMLQKVADIERPRFFAERPSALRAAQRVRAATSQIGARFSFGFGKK